MLFRSGGCNFPNKPAAEGGEKVYYRRIYGLDLSNSDAQWCEVGLLPFPLAYGASVETPDGTIWMGGNQQNGSVSTVWQIHWDATTKQVSFESLPELPVTLDNFAATFSEGILYATGGNQDGVPGCSLFALVLGEGEWKGLTSFPGKARLQPLLMTQQAPDGLRLYLGGGYCPPNGAELGIVHSNLLSYHPTSDSWRQESELPLGPDKESTTWIGAVGFAFGSTQLIAGGGVNAQRFESALNRPLQLQEAIEHGNAMRQKELETAATDYLLHPIEWYKFQNQWMIYNTVEQRWSLSDPDDRIARAGAGMTLHNNQLYLLNGELKPGIRTPDNNVFVWPDIDYLP